MLFPGPSLYLGLSFTVDRHGPGESSDEVDLHSVDRGTFECWLLLISFTVGMQLSLLAPYRPCLTYFEEDEIGLACEKEGLSGM